MADHGVIIPVLQRNCRLIGKAPLLLDAENSIRVIKSEHLGAILAKRNSFAEHVNPKSKCLLIRAGAAPATPQSIADRALCASFAMNVFAGQGSISFGKAFSYKHLRAYSITSVADLPFVSESQGQSFSFDPSARTASVAALFSGAITAVAKDPSLRISLRRFNAAISKSSMEDQIIDLAVCLESTFDSSGEISFRFSLFNALLAGGPLGDRIQNHEKLKKFYSQRSKIVHGSSSPDAVWFSANWDAIVKIAKVSLVAKIDFLQAGTATQWQPHLTQLALG